MEIEKWLKELRGKKKIIKHSRLHLDITTSPDRKTMTISSDDEKVIVNFKEPQKRLSIFEAEALYKIFALGRIPHDYAKYHECVAGRKFIENVKSVRKLDKITTWR